MTQDQLAAQLNAKRAEDNKKFKEEQLKQQIESRSEMYRIQRETKARNSRTEKDEMKQSGENASHLHASRTSNDAKEKSSRLAMKRQSDREGHDHQKRSERKNERNLHRNMKANAIVASELKAETRT